MFSSSDWMSVSSWVGDDYRPMPVRASWAALLAGSVQRAALQYGRRSITDARVARPITEGALVKSR